MERQGSHKVVLLILSPQIGLSLNQPDVSPTTELFSHEKQAWGCWHLP